MSQCCRHILTRTTTAAAQINDLCWFIWWNFHNAASIENAQEFSLLNELVCHYCLTSRMEATKKMWIAANIMLSISMHILLSKCTSIVWWYCALIYFFFVLKFVYILSLGRGWLTLSVIFFPSIWFSFILFVDFFFPFFATIRFFVLLCQFVCLVYKR